MLDTMALTAFGSSPRNMRTWFVTLGAGPFSELSPLIDVRAKTEFSIGAVAKRDLTIL